MVLSCELPWTSAPEKVTNESRRLASAGPTPLTRRNPSRLRNGPRRILSEAMRFAIAGVIPGRESI
jgi:hypothetical protein